MDAANGFDPLKQALGAGRSRPRHRRQSALLLQHPAERCHAAGRKRLDAAGLTGAGARDIRARDHREAVRPRPRRRARELNAATCTPRSLEEQIYRIDHYLGKETVQNLLVFRFANGDLRAAVEPAVHRPRADHRGGRDRRRGARRVTTRRPARCATSCRTTSCSSLRIMGMEAPSNFQAEMVRDEKVKLLRAVRPIHPDDALVALGARAVLGGHHQRRARPRLSRGEGRRARLDCARRSSPSRWTSTTGAGPARRSTCAPASGCRNAPPRSSSSFAAFRTRRSRAAFPSPPVRCPRTASIRTCSILRIQPDEGITLRFGAKIPGQALRIESVNMDFMYGTAFQRAIARRVRATPARLHARRPDALCARGRGRGGVAVLHRDSRRVARASPGSDSTARTTRRGHGARRKRMHSWHATGAPGIVP